MFNATPTLPANAISHTQASKPPSLRSWYASTWFFTRSALMALTRFTKSFGSSRSGTSPSGKPNVCESMDAPMRFLPLPRSIKISVVSASSRLSCGVNVPRTSASDAKAVTMSDTGEVTFFFSSPSVHVVRIDSESLPTGIDMPNAGHSSMPTAFTVSNSAASWPGSPQAAIQLADSLTRGNSIGAASRLVMASATAMRPDAAAFVTASGVRSPMAIASPAKPM